MNNNNSFLSSFLILLFFFSCFTGCVTSPDAEYHIFANIIYQKIPDIDPNLVSLDIYVPKYDSNSSEKYVEVFVDNKTPNLNLKHINSTMSSSQGMMPVMIWVHGGGWRAGDKSNQLQYKIPYFIKQDWVFVSVNYRLSPYELPENPEDLDFNRIQYPIHNQDVSMAIAWVHDHIEEFGGNPNNISLIGHSAGAGIVASIGTNETFLNEHELTLSDLQHVICLDTAAYDIRQRCETGLMLYLNAFGTNPLIWDAASPMNNIDANESLPSFFVVVQGTQKRINQSMKFVDKIENTGAMTEIIVTLTYDHSEINRAIGHPEDDIITPPLSTFLRFS